MRSVIPLQKRPLGCEHSVSSEDLALEAFKVETIPMGSQRSHPNLHMPQAKEEYGQKADPSKVYSSLTEVQWCSVCYTVSTQYISADTG
jgi:hypothetical protein